MNEVERVILEMEKESALLNKSLKDGWSRGGAFQLDVFIPKLRKALKSVNPITFQEILQRDLGDGR